MKMVNRHPGPNSANFIYCKVGREGTHTSGSPAVCGLSGKSDNGDAPDGYAHCPQSASQFLGIAPNHGGPTSIWESEHFR